MPKTRIISTVIAAAAASGITLALAAAPAMATPTTTGTAPSTTPSTQTPPPACASAPPLTKPCSATVTNAGGTYTVTLPGVGTLTFTIDPTTNQVVLPANAVSNLGANFTATTPKVNGDGVSVTFINAATPKQVYHLDVDVKATTTGGTTATTVTAVVKGGHGHDGHHSGDGGDGDHHGATTGTFSGARPGGSAGNSSGSGRH